MSCLGSGAWGSASFCMFAVRMLLHTCSNPGVTDVSCCVKNVRRETYVTECSDHVVAMERTPTVVSRIFLSHPKLSLVNCAMQPTILPYTHYPVQCTFIRIIIIIIMCRNNFCANLRLSLATSLAKVLQSRVTNHRSFVLCNGINAPLKQLRFHCSTKLPPYPLGELTALPQTS